MFFAQKFVYLILLAEQYLLNYNKNAAVIIKYSKDILTFFTFQTRKENLYSKPIINKFMICRWYVN